MADALKQLSMKPVPKQRPQVAVRVPTRMAIPRQVEESVSPVSPVSPAVVATSPMRPIDTSAVAPAPIITIASGATGASGASKYAELLSSLQSRGISRGVESKATIVDDAAKIAMMPKVSAEEDSGAVAPPTRRVIPKGVKLVRKTGDSGVGVGVSSKMAAFDSAIADLEKTLTFTPDIVDATFNGVSPVKRLATPAIPPVRASQYYLNNHRRFIASMSSLFAPYRAEIEAEKKMAVSCEGRRSEAGSEFSLLTHQKVVRDYIQVFTPYRGILIYHGLGSGKTCTSIAIAESFKDNKKIMIMTPASLQESYRQELRKCGDVLFRRNQYWEFLAIDKKDETAIAALAKVTGLEPRYVRTKGGAWLVDRTKAPNVLSMEDREAVDAQIDRMIDAKYHFVNYNGITKRLWNAMTTEEDMGRGDGAGDDAEKAAAAASDAEAAKLAEEFGREKKKATKGATSGDGEAARPIKRINPFDDCVVIVDEAHNLMSRIVNKLTRKTTVASEIYQFMMSAHNARFVFLSGTPLINYPNEMAIMFNILRGHISAWTMKVKVNTDRRIDEAVMRDILKGISETDYVEYKPTTGQLTVTRNPFGFANVRMRDGTASEYAGVTEDKKSRTADRNFLAAIRSRLSTNGMEIVGDIKVSRYTALPDSLDQFAERFLKSDGKGEIQNPNLLRRRVLGLTSYFRSAQEQLLPRFVPKDKPKQLVDITMSDYQLGLHEEERVKERDQERRRKKPAGGNAAAELYKDTTSTYRIFSRAACNFVFPEGVERPKIKKGKGAVGKTGKKGAEGAEGDADADMGEIDEDDIDNASLRERAENPDARVDDDDARTISDELSSSEARSYAERLQDALDTLDRRAAEFLTPEALSKYSPKFLAILRKLQSDENRGLNLIYSQFRTLEGIGVLALVLKHNGFVQLKVKNVDGGSGGWRLDMSREERAPGVKRFALYTGTETSDEREIIRKIFNGEWRALPDALQEELRGIHPDNRYGEVAKVLMITSSGAEGINLRNVRYVHIVEPYWHPSRIDQVIGRARRICSHEDLPEEDRTVEVFMYRMVYPDAITDPANRDHAAMKEKYVSLFNSPGDKGKESGKILPSDGILYEISEVKNKTNQGLLKAVKETAIDCPIYVSGSDEGLVCFTFGPGRADEYEYASVPDIKDEPSDALERRVIKRVEGVSAAAAAAAASSTGMAVPTKAVKTDIIMEMGYKDGRYAVNLDTGEAYVLESYKRTPPVYELVETVTSELQKRLPALQKKAAEQRQKKTAVGAITTTTTST